MSYLCDLLCLCNPYHLEEDSDEAAVREEMMLEMAHEKPYNSRRERELLPANFDPEQNYYDRYGLEEGSIRQDKMELLKSSEVSQQSLMDGRSLLSEEGLTPRNTVIGLKKLRTAILMADNMLQKKKAILEYEVAKALHDTDNVDDREKADLYLEYAQSECQSLTERVTFYQIAITHTNGFHTKHAIWQEYNRFCRAHMTQDVQ